MYFRQRVHLPASFPRSFFALAALMLHAGGLRHRALPPSECPLPFDHHLPVLIFAACWVRHSHMPRLLRDGLFSLRTCDLQMAVAAGNYFVLVGCRSRFTVRIGFNSRINMCLVIEINNSSDSSRRTRTRSARLYIALFKGCESSMFRGWHVQHLKSWAKNSDVSRWRID